MSHPKNQHYVPRAYLKQFSLPHERGLKNPRVCSFDKSSQRVRYPSVKTAASELHFYEDTDTGVERALQRLEDLFAGPYRRLLAMSSIAALSVEDRVTLAIFLGVQLVRTREHREAIRSVGLALQQWMAREGIEDPHLGNASEEFVRAVQVSSLRDDSDRFAKILLGMKWVLGVNMSTMPFWTSDNPITLYNPLPSGVRGNIGLHCRGIQMFFPLSPTRALGVCDPVEYASMPCDIVSNDVNHAMFLNSLQVAYSTRFVYSCMGNFDLARAVLAERPEFSDLNRLRMQAL